MKHKSGSQKRQAMELEIWIPQLASVMAMKAMQEYFPYRAGEWFDQSVTSQKAPAGFHLAEDLSTEQVAYLGGGEKQWLDCEVRCL